MAAKHKFGMRMRLILVIFTEKKSFIAYYTWRHLAGYVEIMDIMLEHEPEIWINISNRKILLRPGGDILRIDMDSATYDVEVELAINDMADKNYIAADALVELIRQDPQNWEIEEIPK